VLGAGESPRFGVRPALRDLKFNNQCSFKGADDDHNLPNLFAFNHEEQKRRQGASLQSRFAAQR
jgi:hypothetical protein